MKPVRWPLVARRLHKWLALIVGVQIAIWTVTGFYMVAVHIDHIHGDHLVRPPASASVAPAALAAPGEVAAQVPGATAVTLIRRDGGWAWLVEAPGGRQVRDAATGAPLAALDAAAARAAALARYAGDPTIVAVSHLTATPQELGKRPGPFWQVEFAGWNRPTLYIDPLTGALIARRHLAWRVFDVGWMLHIMDYRERSDVNNPLLRTATWGAVLAVTSGAWLLLWAFPKRRRRKPAKAMPA